MAEEGHPNISLLEKLDFRNLDLCTNFIAENFVWHYFNPSDLSPLQ